MASQQLVQVFVGVTLSAAITPAAISTPSVGLLIRLGIACYINVPVSTVFINGITVFNATTGNSTVISVALTDPVNTATGSCSLLNTTQARRLLKSYAEEAAAGRRLVGTSSTKVNMGVNVYTAPTDSPSTSSQVLSIQSSLSPLLSATGSNLTVGGGSILSTVFGTFLSSAANASGVPLSSVSIGVDSSTSVAYVPLASPSPRAGGSTSSSTSSSTVALSAGAIAGIVIGSLVAVALIILLVVFLISSGGSRGGARADADGAAKPVTSSQVAPAPTGPVY